MRKHQLPTEPSLAACWTGLELSSNLGNGTGRWENQPVVKCVMMIRWASIAHGQVSHATRRRRRCCCITRPNLHPAQEIDRCLGESTLYSNKDGELSTERTPPKKPFSHFQAFSGTLSAAAETCELPLGIRLGGRWVYAWVRSYRDCLDADDLTYFALLRGSSRRSTKPGSILPG